MSENPREVKNIEITEGDAIGYLLGYLEAIGVDLSALVDGERDTFRPPYHDFSEYYEVALAELEGLTKEIAFSAIVGMNSLLDEDIQRANERAKDIALEVLKAQLDSKEDNRYSTGSARDYYQSSAKYLVEKLRRLKSIEIKYRKLKRQRDEK